MEFEGCFDKKEKNACVQLINSLTSFEPNSYERTIRLAVSPPLPVPLNLTIHHGPCAISCEGGDLSSCETTKEDHYWSDVFSPFYFENCVPSHNYCVTASIGECCPVCTKTVFMEELHQEYYSIKMWQWDTEMIILTVSILILLLLSLIILKNYFNSGLNSLRVRSQKIISDPLTQHILEIGKENHSHLVVCLYLRENDIFFSDMVDSVQEYLRRKGIDVIDIYNEEEIINQSIAKWVQDIFKKENTKILLFDTVNTHRLWNGDVDKKKLMKPLEQAVCYIRSCIPITDVHKHLFVVRFQGMNIDANPSLHLSDGRCYLYPVQRERLAIDLKS